jgi:hypothetical protein
MKDFAGLMTVVMLATTLIYLFGLIWWRIFSKTGHHGSLGLLMFVPFVNLIMICVLAFAKWPIQRELEHTRRLLPPKHQTVFDQN